MPLLWAFAAVTSALWLLTAGYLVLLTLLARRTPPAPALAPANWPEVAFVVPTRNEESCIEARLRDLADPALPRVRVVVVDGGSRDATPALVAAAIAGGARLALESLPGAQSKAEQLNHVLAAAREEFVVVSDADARLAPGCVEALVAHLAANPDTAVVGAVVEPASRLAEERLHWQIVNRLWWLEGEALSATGVSGVCYAVRRRAVARIETDTTAEDVQLAIAAGARGLRARLCPLAVATEQRVPQSPAEFLVYRRRRGEGFCNELRRALPPGTPFRLRLFHAVRRLQFDAVPGLFAASVATGALLFASGGHAAVLLAFAAFAAPAALAWRAIPGARVESVAAASLPWAACRLVGLLWFSSIAAPRRPPVQEKVRCSEPVI